MARRIAAEVFPESPKIDVSPGGLLENPTFYIDRKDGTYIKVGMKARDFTDAENLRTSLSIWREQDW